LIVRGKEKRRKGTLASGGGGGKGGRLKQEIGYVLMQ